MNKKIFLGFALTIVIIAHDGYAGLNEIIDLLSKLHHTLRPVPVFNATSSLGFALDGIRIVPGLMGMGVEFKFDKPVGSLLLPVFLAASDNLPKSEKEYLSSEERVMAWMCTAKQFGIPKEIAIRVIGDNPEDVCNPALLATVLKIKPRKRKIRDLVRKHPREWFEKALPTLRHDIKKRTIELMKQETIDRAAEEMRKLGIHDNFDVIASPITLNKNSRLLLGSMRDLIDPNDPQQKRENLISAHFDEMAK